MSTAFDLSHELIQAARLGDPAARDRLAEACLPVVLGWANRMSPAGVDPEDVAHDSLVQALNSLHQLRDPARFPGWLFQIVKRRIGALRRRAWFRGWVPGLEVEQPVFLEGDSLLVRRVRAALSELPDAQREVLILVDVEGHTCKQAGELVGVPEGTVKSRLRLGRARFAKEAQRRGLSGAVERQLERERV